MRFSHWRILDFNIQQHVKIFISHWMTTADNIICLQDTTFSLTSVHQGLWLLCVIQIHVLLTQAMMHMLAAPLYVYKNHWNWLSVLKLLFFDSTDLSVDKFLYWTTDQWKYPTDWSLIIPPSYTDNCCVWNETRHHSHVTAAVGSCYQCWNRCDDSRGLHLDIAADRPGSPNFPDDEAAPFPLPPWRHPTNPDSAVETPDYHLSA